MTSKLKCPICKKPLEQVGTSRQYQCGSWGCDASFDMIGTEALWQALIQAKQDLETARWVMKDIDALLLSRKFDITELGRLNTIQSLVSRALKATEHKEQ